MVVVGCNDCAVAEWQSLPLSYGGLVMVAKMCACVIRTRTGDVSFVGFIVLYICVKSWRRADTVKVSTSTRYCSTRASTVLE